MHTSMIEQCFCLGASVTVALLLHSTELSNKVNNQQNMGKVLFLTYPV